MALLVCVLAPLAAVAAQPQGNVPRVGFLIAETLSGQASRIEALRAGLRERGYVEGKNIAIEVRSADGNYDRLSELAAELVRLKVDVLVAFGSKAVLAAKDATSTIPIVVPVMSDPVAVGVASSVARPGGNITGSATFAEVVAKRLELLKQTVPRITRVAVLLNPANPTISTEAYVQPRRATAKALNLETPLFEVRTAGDFGRIFSAMAERRVDAVLASTDTLFQANERTIADLAAKQRLPPAGRKEFAEAGA